MLSANDVIYFQLYNSQYGSEPLQLICQSFVCTSQAPISKRLLSFSLFGWVTRVRYRKPCKHSCPLSCRLLACLDCESKRFRISFFFTLHGSMLCYRTQYMLLFSEICLRMLLVNYRSKLW